MEEYKTKESKRNNLTEICNIFNIQVENFIDLFWVLELFNILIMTSKYIIKIFI